MRQVKRERVLNLCEPFIDGRRRLLLIEAQAGQGKSTLARQVTDQLDKTVCLVECDKNDAALVNLMEKFFSNLALHTPGLNGTEIIQAVCSCPSQDELLLLLPEMLKSISSEKTLQKTVLLLEDAHLLLKAPHSLKGLRLLFDHLGHCLSMIITSRSQLPGEQGLLFRRNESVLISNQTLAFDKSEVLLLYRQAYGLDLDNKKAGKLLAITEGWPFGLSLLRTELNELDRRQGLAPGSELDNYFNSQCLGILSPEEADALVDVSLLENIPLALLGELELHTASRALKTLYDKGCFITNHRQDGSDFLRMHHLLQACLRNIVENRSRLFCVRAAGWFLRNGQLGQALDLLARSGDVAELKKALYIHGSNLMLMNRLSLVVQALKHLPENIVNEEPLLLALWGNEKLHQNPGQALRLLEAAWKMAGDKKENLAELLAGLGLINYQLLFHGNLWKLRRVTKRVMELFALLEEQKEITAMLAGACSYLICFSVTYTMADYGLADKFAEKAEEIFRSHSEGSVPLGITVARIYTKSARGYLKESLLRQQKNYLYLNSPTVNPSTKFICYLSYTNFSMMKGYFLDYWSLRDELFKKQAIMVKNSAMGAFYYIWDMDMLMSKGDFSGVLELANKALASDLVKKTNHIASQCHQYIALAYAFLGKKEAALAAVSRSMHLRARVGGVLFILLNHLVAGSVWGISGEFKKAERVFKIVLKRLAAAEDRYFMPQAHAYRAHARLLEGKEKEALDDVKSMLEIMGSVENYHFFYWEGFMVRRLLEFYFKNIKKPSEFALKLYRKRFGMDYISGGETIPRLRLSLAEGRLYCLDAPDVFIDLADVPGKESMLLDCLLRTPDRSVSQEKIIDRIWPEGAKATKPRDNLYQTVHKLRARFAAITNKKLAKKYLRTSSEGHALCHVDVDLNHLLDQAKKGLADLSQNRFWMAEMHFREMKRLLDPFPVDYKWLVDESRLLAKAVVAWVDLLFRVGETERALEAVEMGLKVDPANDGLHNRRYRLYMELAMPAKAAQAKSDYERLFKEAG